MIIKTHIIYFKILFLLAVNKKVFNKHKDNKFYKARTIPNFNKVIYFMVI